MAHIKKTKRQHLFMIATMIIALVLMAGCKKKQKNAHIDPPFDELDPAFKTFTVQNDKADTLTLNSGTRIFVPPQAFTDSTDSIVTGEVDINYREFHDALDIFLAGIPMGIDVMGETKHLETAGMFEIRAKQGTKNLKLADGKNIGVELASKTAGPQYNFFGLDEEDGKWKFMGYPESRVNPEYQQMKQEIDELKNTDDFISRPGYFIFDYRGAVDIYKYELKGKVNDQNAFKQRVKRYGIDWLSVDNRHMIYFKGNRYHASFMLWKNISGKPLPQWLRKNGYFYTQTQRITGNIYHVTIKSGENRFDGRIEAIMPLRALLSFTPEYWKNHFEEVMQQVKEEQQRLRNEAKLFRVFDINSLGIKNFDCLFKAKNPVNVEAEFKVEETNGNEIYELQQVFCLPGNNKTLIKLNRHNWHSVMLAPADTNFRFITVLPNNRLGIYPLEKYRAMNFDSLRKVQNPRVVFTLEPMKEPVESRAQLEELLGFE